MTITDFLLPALVGLVSLFASYMAERGVNRVGQLESEIEGLRGDIRDLRRSIDDMYYRKRKNDEDR